VVDHREQEERVALGAPEHELDELPGHAGAQLAAQAGFDLRAPEGRRRELAPGQVALRQGAEQAAQRVALHFDLGRPEGGEEQQRQLAQTGSQVGEQVDARRIGPVQILEGEHHRRELARHPVAAAPPLEQLLPARGGDERREVRRPGRRHPGERGGERFARRSGEQRLERVEEGRIGLRRGEVLGGAAEADQRVGQLAARAAQERGDERRLAGARLAADGDQVAEAVGRARGEPGQALELRFAADRLGRGGAAPLARGAGGPPGSGRRDPAPTGRGERAGREGRHPLRERRDELAGRARPPLRFLLQGREQRRLGRLRQLGHQGARRLGRARDVRHQDRLHGQPAEGRHAGQQLVGDHAQAVDVGGGSRRQTLALLRAHVERRADGVRAGQLRVVPGEQLGEAEVGDLDAAAGEQDVGGLEVAVDDSRRVRRVDRRRDLGEQLERRRRRERALATQPVGEVAAVGELHDHGCASCPAARASRRKRSNAAGAWKSSPCRILIATRRSIASWSAS